MTIQSLPPRLRHAGVLALLSLAGLLLLAILPSCTSSPAPSYTGVSRVGTPLPGEPGRGASPQIAGEFDSTGARSGSYASNPTTDPATGFTRSSLGNRPRYANRVGEPIPGVDDLPPITALSGAGPGLGAFASAGVEIGLSLRGTPIHAIEFGGTGGPKQPASMGLPSEKRVYLIGLIHGDEDEGYGAIDDVLSLLHAAAGPNMRVRVVPTMNPDGQIAGRRGNANGIDLNRNWPASNFTPAKSRGESPADQPEVAAVLRDLRTFSPELLIVFHSIGNDGPFVNFDGPAKARDLAEAFAEAASIAGGGNWGVKASMGYETPGSLGTWAGVDRKIPTLTVEFRSRQRPAEVSRAAVAGVRAVIGEMSR